MLFNDSHIYYKQILKQRVNLFPYELNKKYEEYIKKYLQDKIEGICIREGYVKKNSIEILKRSSGVIEKGHTTGQVSFDVVYSAKICNPSENDVIYCEIKDINKIGALAEVYNVEESPLCIIIAKQYHSNFELFNSSNLFVGKKIFISVIGKSYELYDTKITVLGKIVDADTNNTSIQQFLQNKLNYNNNKYIGDFNGEIWCPSLVLDKIPKNHKHNIKIGEEIMIRGMPILPNNNNGLEGIVKEIGKEKSIVKINNEEITVDNIYLTKFINFNEKQNLEGESNIIDDIDYTFIQEYSLNKLEDENENENENENEDEDEDEKIKKKMIFPKGIKVKFISGPHLGEIGVVIKNSKDKTGKTKGNVSILLSDNDDVIKVPHEYQKDFLEELKE